MSKRSSSTKKPDRIALLHEWVEHMYNTGYWFNRISLANLSSREWAIGGNRIVGCAGMLLIGMILMLLAAPTISYWLTNARSLMETGLSIEQIDWSSMPAFLIMLGLFIGSVYLFFMPPDRG